MTSAATEATAVVLLLLSTTVVILMRLNGLFLWGVLLFFYKEPLTLKALEYMISKVVQI